MKTGAKILIAPLDWGLGHASRCVPFINFLINNGFKVVIGGCGASLDFLRQRFPDLPTVQLPSAKMKYGKHGMISLPFLSSMFRFAMNIHKEHRALKKIITEHSIDYVISDNRLGLYSESVPSFYMTHQLNFDNGFANRFAAWIMKRIHSHYINKYRYCLVPDAEGDFSLSGIMSCTNIPTIHIGPMSRFYEMKAEKAEGNFDLLLLSGIEPQRTALETIFIEKYSSMPDMHLHIVRGVENDSAISLPTNISFENNPTDKRIASLIVSARRVFCRSGYSTLCDLAALGQRAALVPTPRQPEQEYLAKYFNSKFGFTTFNQNELPNANFSKITYDTNWNYNYFCNLNEILK